MCVLSRFLHAARNGCLTSAWKQLWSYGLAPASPETVRKIQAKWLGGGAPLSSDFTLATPAQMADLLAEASLTSAVHHLAAGSMPDVFGWTHVTTQQLWAHPAFRTSVRDLLVLYGTGECGSLVADMLNLSKVVPLSKDSRSDQVRPIAVPTTMRKLYARCAVLRWKRVFALAVGPHQYGCMKPNGAAVCARQARCAAEARGDHHCFARTDIQTRSTP